MGIDWLTKEKTIDEYGVLEQRQLHDTTRVYQSEDLFSRAAIFCED
jgi:hypothetical protein